MNRRDGTLAAAIAATLAAPAVAWAATYTATLTDVVSYSNNGSAAGAISSSTATWTYDDVTGELIQSGGTFEVRFNTSPTNTLFRHSITGLIIGNGAAAAAATFVCTEGNFGSGVNASICGNYRLGANFVNESTTTWGPGTSVSRTLGGDDMGIPPQPFPPPQNLSQYDGFAEQSLAGSTLVLSSATCLSTDEGVVCIAGYDWTLTLADASPDTATTTLNTPTAPIDVLANDPGVGDPVTVSIIAAPDQGGSVAMTNDGAACAEPCTAPRADIRLVLTPSAPGGTAAYTETFTYQVTDGITTASADVVVAVQEGPPTLPPTLSFTGLRDDAGGSALDLVSMALFGGAWLSRRRR